MEHLNGRHERADARRVVLRSRHLTCSVENGVKLSNLVFVSNLREQLLDLLPCARLREVPLRHAHLDKSAWEQKVDGFGLVAVVLEISD